MSPNPAFVEEIMTQSRAALSRLEQLEAIRSFVETGLPIPRPYLGSGEIRLVIIGQDPTVQQQQQRAGIKTVLNLDKRGGLNTYLAQLCQDLGLSLANVYATNASPPQPLKR
jgi:hypothetical protein